MLDNHTEIRNLQSKNYNLTIEGPFWTFDQQSKRAKLLLNHGPQASPIISLSELLMGIVDIRFNHKWCG